MNLLFQEEYLTVRPELPWKKQAGSRDAQNAGLMQLRHSPGQLRSPNQTFQRNPLSVDNLGNL